MKIKKIATLWVSVCLALLMIPAVVVAVGGSPVLSVSDGSIAELGSTTTVSMTLDEAPLGFTGYNVTVSLSNSTIGEIMEVAFPFWAIVLPTNSTLPADSFWMKAADFTDAVKIGDTNIDLGTLTIRGDAEGECTIDVTVNMMSDNVTGDPIDPAVSPGTLRVGQWESYKTSACTEVWGEASSHYDSTYHTAYMRGEGFADGHSYKIGYYDSSGDQASSTESASSNATGVLDGAYDLNTDPGAAAGTWHSVVFNTTEPIPDTYDAAKLDPNYVVEDDFIVDASAIPEFPTVMAGIGVAGLCFGIYYWMRKRKQRQVATA